MEQVTFEHPHTKDRQTVDATVEAMQPLMNRGYQQAKDAPKAEPVNEEGK